MARMRRQAAGALVALVMGTLLVATVQAEDWQTILDYDGYEDVAVGAVADANGNTYVLATCIVDEDNQDVVVFKLDADGDTVGNPWVYDSGEDEDVAIAMVLDEDEGGGALYVLSAIGDADDYEEFHTTKFNLANGHKDWTEEYSDATGSGYPVGIALHQNPPNRSWVVVFGMSEPTSEQPVYRVIRYTDDGDSAIVTWNVAHDWNPSLPDTLTRVNEPYAVGIDGASNTYIVGKSNTAVEGDEGDSLRIVALKLNPANGQVVDSSYYNNGGDGDDPEEFLKATEIAVGAGEFFYGELWGHNTWGVMGTQYLTMDIRCPPGSLFRWQDWHES